MQYAKRYIGLLVPSADFVVEQDFKNTLPPHVGTYASRMFHGRNPKSTLENLQKILDAAESAAELVSHANPDVVIFCGTSASFMHGKGSDDDLSKRLSKAAGGIPATNTTSAAVQALKALDIKKLFFYSPYPLPAHQRGVKFFGDHGFDVVDNDTFQCVNSLEIPALQPNDIVARLARHKQTLKRCDGVFASCTNFRVLPVIEKLEKEYGIPIVSANQATIWAGLRAIKEPTKTVKGAGRLFQAG